jgi:putative acetyltransferase
VSDDDLPPRLEFRVDDPIRPELRPLLEPTGEPVALQRPDVSLLTARVDGEPVACGACVDQGDYVEVKRMYVLPACRGLGLGKQLLEAMETHIRRSGRRLVRLETGTAQTEALDLYERAGYRRCPPFGEHHANPRSVCMEKVLA